MKYLLLVAIACLSLLALTSCEKETWESIKPIFVGGLLNAVNAAKSDPGVQAAVLSGNYELAGKRGLRAAKVEFKNIATGWALSTDNHKKAYNYINDRWPLVAAIFDRGNGEGFYWEARAFLESKSFKLTVEEIEAVYPLARKALEDNYYAAKEYLDGPVDTTDGIDTGGEW